MCSTNDHSIALAGDILEPTEGPAIQMRLCQILDQLSDPFNYHIDLKYHEGAIHDVRLCLRAVVHRPALGALVKSLHIDLQDEDGGLDPAPYMLLVPDDLRSFLREAALRSLPQEVQMGLERSSTGPMLLLLLCYLPHLDSLRINRSSSTDTVFFRHMLSTSPLPYGLQTLSDVEINHGSTDAVLDENFIIPFFHLPQLHEFKSEGGFVDLIHSDRLPAGSSNVKEITLTLCTTNPNALATIIRSSRTLRSVDIGYEVCQMSFAKRSARSLGNALRESATPALEYFAFEPTGLHNPKCCTCGSDVRDDDFEDDEVPTRAGPLGSLSDVVGINRVFVALSMILRKPNKESNVIPLPLTALLPPSIFELSLWIDKGWGSIAAKEIIDVLISKHKNLTLLSALNLTGHVNVSDIEIIKAACEAKGVEYTNKVRYK